MADKIITFAAVYIGTYEISMKIFELSSRRKIRKIDLIRRRIDLGRDTLSHNAVSADTMNELCGILEEFVGVMRSYQVTASKAFAGPFLNDASNKLFLLGQIKTRTGLPVTILSNSEQRFMSYRAVASLPDFENYTKEGAAVVDIGGASLQITLFDQGEVVTTQHLILGTVRLREKLSVLSGETAASYRQQIRELVDKEMEVFRSMYMKNRQIKNMILIGDYCSNLVKRILKKKDNTVVSIETFLKFINKISAYGREKIVEELDLFDENDSLLIPALLLVKQTAETLSSDTVWIPGSSINDGIAYEYAQKSKIFTHIHDFDHDVKTAAIYMAKRYESYSPHVKGQLVICDTLFDAVKKVAGLSRRDKLLLEIASILHDCGKYISSVTAAECSYEIIMASEIIGLTHEEREIIASSVLYNVHELPPYEELADKLSEESYLTVGKISQILRLANALDRSHQQKVRSIKAAVKNRQLVVTAMTTEEIVLEKQVFESKADGFEEIYSIRPVIREKRML